MGLLRLLFQAPERRFLPEFRVTSVCSYEKILYVIFARSPGGRRLSLAFPSSNLEMVDLVLLPTCFVQLLHDSIPQVRTQVSTPREAPKACGIAGKASKPINNQQLLNKKQAGPMAANGFTECGKKHPHP